MSAYRVQSRPVYQPQVSSTSRPEPAAPTQSTQAPPASRRAQQQDSFESAPAKGPVALDGGAPPPGTTGTAGVQQATPVAPIDGVDPQVLQTQEKLSQARQKLGDWHLRGSPDESTLVQLENEVAELEAQEKAQFENPDLKDDVEKAQFAVLQKRMGELEQEHGKEQAVTLARQTYYNSDLWNLAGGSEKASDAQVLALGLPHTPGDKDTGVAAGGFRGQMRTPDGQPVDMGHVLCGMDWQLNKDRIPKKLSVDDLAKAAEKEGLADILEKLPGGGPDIDNPFTLDFVTLEGDLGSAVASRYGGESADKAVAEESDYDWNSDLDGLNLAKRLETNPNQSLSDTLNAYYGNGEYKNRVDEYATHGKYVKRDGNGQPVRDEAGHYKMDIEAMAEDGIYGGIILSRGDIAGAVAKDTLDPRSNKAEETARAFEQWLHRAQDAA
jgi:hypothetical protein